MPRYKLIVMTRAKDRQDAEFNEWYDAVHLRDVVAIPGIASAQRYRFSRNLNESEALPYCAVYDIETDDIDGVMGEFNKRTADGRMPISDALDPNLVAIVYEEMGPRVEG